MSKVWKNRWQDICILAGVTLIAYLAGIAVYVFLMNGEAGTDWEEGFLALGNILGYVGIFGFLLIYGMSGFGSLFGMAVSMGMTRKKFMGAYYLITFCTILVLGAMMSGLGLLLKAVIPLPVFQMQEAAQVQFLHQFPFWIFMALLATGLESLAGALCIKYGMKGFWIMWLIWMISFTVLPGLLENSHDQNTAAGKVIAQLGQMMMHLSTMQLYGAGFLVSLGVVLITWLMLRKQAVIC